ncbi:hypothetical protein ACFPOG_12430 [Paenibacillus aestuarii]|uniref:Uncharacterized protein n=1 Tax=Paenibacillus aestuarii TaxID=516965 RepID=A0ABW0K954_9BACL
MRVTTFSNVSYSQDRNLSSHNDEAIIFADSLDDLHAQLYIRLSKIPDYRDFVRTAIDPYENLGYEQAHEGDLTCILEYFTQSNQKELGEQYVKFRQGNSQVCPEGAYHFWAKHLYTMEYDVVEATEV